MAKVWLTKGVNDSGLQGCSWAPSPPALISEQGFAHQVWILRDGILSALRGGAAQQRECSLLGRGGAAALLPGKATPLFLEEEIEDLILSTTLLCSLGTAFPSGAAPTGGAPAWGRRQVPPRTRGQQQQRAAPAGWRQRPRGGRAAPRRWGRPVAISVLRGRAVSCGVPRLVNGATCSRGCGKGHPEAV